jgi:hypothetical protein
MTRSLPILLSCSLLAATAWINATYASARFPSISDLERDLHLYKGAQLPRDVQAPDGMIFHTYYVGGRELGNGEYAVIVKLDR